MMREVDCRGLECPKPVINTKAALAELTEGAVATLVDNPIARDNVLRLANSMHLPAEVKELEGQWQIIITKTAGACCQAAEALLDPQELSGDYVLFIRGNTLGHGSDELGGMLMKSLLYTVANHDKAPQKICLLNSGVELVCEGSPVLDSFQLLAEKGVEIIACGTCLDFFHLKEKLAVGRVGNMYDIFDTVAAHRTISI